tara:strand:- start:62 stop:736 length:675 start_codon:yes stop_codon:yes gene_type:complete
MAFKMKNKAVMKMAKMAGNNRTAMKLKAEDAAMKMKKQSAMKHIVKVGTKKGTEAPDAAGAYTHNQAHRDKKFDMNHQQISSPKKMKKGSAMDMGHSPKKMKKGSAMDMGHKKKDGKPGRFERAMNKIAYKVQDIGDAYNKSKLGKFMGNLDYKLNMLMDPPTEAEKRESARMKALVEKQHKEYLKKKQKEKDKGGPAGPQPTGPGFSPAKMKKKSAMKMKKKK